MMYENNPLPFPKGKARRARSRKRKFLLILLLFLIASAGGVFLFFRETEDEKASPVVEIPDPPIVASEEIKSPPEEPGGLEIAHQDKLIYERLTPADVTVFNENALDEVMMGLVAEDPLADFSASSSDEDSTESANLPGSDEDSIEPATDPDFTEDSPEPITPEDSTEPVTAPDDAGDSPEPMTTPDSAGDSVEPATPSIESEESTPEEEVEPAPEPSTTPLPESNGSGDYVVQLASFTRSADAEVALTRMASKFSDVVGTNTLFIQETDLGDRGIWYRLRVGYFTAHGDAAEVCERFQSRGQDCLVTAR